MSKVETLGKLVGSKICSKIDLKRGFWYVGIDNQTKNRTAFATKFGVYEWNVMSMSLSNAPATF